MGYRPDEEELEYPINQIIVGMKQFDQAVQRRIEGGDWSDDHLKKIGKINTKLQKLKIKLLEVKKDTW
jgi:hypothetical protein